MFLCEDLRNGKKERDLLTTASALEIYGLPQLGGLEGYHIYPTILEHGLKYSKLANGLILWRSMALRKLRDSKCVRSHRALESQLVCTSERADLRARRSSKHETPPIAS